MGKPWYYPNLEIKLNALWKLSEGSELVDLGFGCYCLKGIMHMQRELILTQGPWQIAGNFLLIRKWTPNFTADNDKIEHAITWVRVLNLTAELFRESVIQTIASCIGDPIKIDGNPFTATRGKFARFCVQVPRINLSNEE